MPPVKIPVGGYAESTILMASEMAEESASEMETDEESIAMNAVGRSYRRSHDQGFLVFDAADAATIALGLNALSNGEDTYGHERSSTNPEGRKHSRHAAKGLATLASEVSKIAYDSPRIDKDRATRTTMAAYEKRVTVDADIDCIVKNDGNGWKIVVVLSGDDDPIQTIDVTDTSPQAIGRIMETIFALADEMAAESPAVDVIEEEPPAVDDDLPMPAEVEEVLEATPPTAAAVTMPPTPPPLPAASPTPPQTTPTRPRTEVAVKACARAAAIMATLDASDEALDRSELVRDAHTDATRTALNVCAAWTARETVEMQRNAGRFIEVVRNDATTDDLRTMAHYSGLGGLSAIEHKEKFPDTFPVPDARGLLDEYYTPRKVANEVARVIFSLIDEKTPTIDGTIHALEPSAGIGRFVNAMKSDKYATAWHAVEISATSAYMLKAQHPEMEVYNGPFERWVGEHGEFWGGKLGLLISNPPYPREARADKTDDPKWELYDEKFAARYFLRRGLDLLGRWGFGFFLIPSGFLTSKSAAGKKIRERVLARHHLVAAFRPPSDIFPGAHLVTDLLFFRSRGGDLKRVPAEDAFIVDGNYYDQFPSHILGDEVNRPGSAAEDQPEEEDRSAEIARRRLRHKVNGEWRGIPDFTPRVLDVKDTVEESTDVVSTKRKKPRQAVRSAIEVSTEDLARLSDAERGAVVLGARYDHYASLAAMPTSDEHVLMHPELLLGLEGWIASNGNPYKHPSIIALHEAGDTAVSRFLQAFRKEGGIIDGLLQPPTYLPVYSGDAVTVGAIAGYYYKKIGHLTIEVLSEFFGQHSKQTMDAARSEVYSALPVLFSSGWRIEGAAFSDLVPREEYLYGDLWAKYDALKALLADNKLMPWKGTDKLWGTLPESMLQIQLTELMEAIKPSIFEEINDVSVRQAWVPLNLIAEFIIAPTEERGLGVKMASLELVRVENVVQPVGYDYSTLKTDWGRVGDAAYTIEFTNEIGVEKIQPAFCMLGYMNHDMNLFRPKTKEFEDAGIYRIEMGIQIERRWRAWLSSEESRKTTIEAAYNRAFRGYVRRTFTDEPFPLLRWNKQVGAPIPKPHQWQAARQISHYHRGLLAFDVGVGKTFTGLMILAKLRQDGVCRRPVILVPNSIIFQWLKEMRGEEGKDGKSGKIGVLPDYSAVLIGVNPKVVMKGPRKGELDAEADGVEEQGRKWAKFQAGEYDVALVTHSALDRTRLSEEAVIDYVETRTAIQRVIELGDIRGRRKGKKARERGDAMKREAVKGWIKEKLNAGGENRQFVPGIVWDDIGIDFFMVDEAQAYKNLYMPEASETGAVPKYMGNAGSGSNRAWQFEFRVAAVRKRARGVGVVLLSATPAKNSPVEFYSMLQYVDPHVWEKMGLLDAEQFIDRFLVKELVDVNLVDGGIEKALACVGFKNLDEMRVVLDRYAIFKTAEEAKLKLPMVNVGFADESGGVFRSKTDDEGVIHYFDAIGAEIQVEDVGISMNSEQRERYKHFRRIIKEEGKSNPGAFLKAMSMMSLIAAHPKLEGIYTEEMDEHGLMRTVRTKYTWDTAELVEEFESPKFAAVASEIYNNMTCGQVVIAPKEHHKDVLNTIEAYGTPMNRVVTIASEKELPMTAKFAHGRPAKKGEFEVVVTTPELFTRASIGDKACGVYTIDAKNEEDRAKQMKAAGWSIVIARTCSHIVFIENIAAHVWLRKTFVARGIPEDRIAILNAITQDGPGRVRVAEQFNGDPDNGKAPKYDVIIANAVAYEGINLQQRTCAIHHVDLPWEPATLQQRNGRGVRQGNIRGTIKIRYYFSKRSLDGLRFSAIVGKRGWMTSVIASQDRETNNPGAGIQISREDVLIFTADDPEEARVIANEAKARRALERIANTQKEAVGWVAQINGKFRLSERKEAEGQPGLAAAARTDAEEILKRLMKIDAKAWPWAQLTASVVRNQYVWPLAGGLPPLFEGLRVRVERYEGAQPEFYEFGRLNGDKIGVRRPMEGIWAVISTTDASNAISPGLIDVAPPDWPTDDSDAIVDRFSRWANDHSGYAKLGRLRQEDELWKFLGWAWASAAWLEWAWPTLGPMLVTRWYDNPRMVYTKTQPGGGGFVRTSEGIGFVGLERARPKFTDIIPPTVEGWRELMAYLPKADSHEWKHGEINDATKWFWNRWIPYATIGNDRPENKPIAWATIDPMEGLLLVDKRFRTNIAEMLRMDREARAIGKAGFITPNGKDLLESAKDFDTKRNGGESTVENSLAMSVHTEHLIRRDREANPPKMNLGEKAQAQMENAIRADKQRPEGDGK